MKKYSVSRMDVYFLDQNDINTNLYDNKKQTNMVYNV